MKLIKFRALIRTRINLGCMSILLKWEKSRLNVSLLSAIIILAGYFAANSFYDYRLPECRTVGTFRTANASPAQKRVPFPVYEGPLSKRSIFGAPVLVRRGQEVGSPSISASSEELRKLTLIGIISVDGKSQALVRDKRKKMEYFCTGGETIGIFEVERILEDRIILKLGDEELELKL